MILVGLVALAALIVAIVLAGNLNALRSRVEGLEANLRRLQRPEERPETTKAAIPPPLPTGAPKPPPLPATPPLATARIPDHAPAINWELFVGVRLFAWIGGLALFMGVVFFVKYAFENNLITPPMRVIAGALIGVALIGAGILPALRRYRIPAQSVIATGILIFYADIYAAHSFYGLISLTAASVLMWLATAVALGLAARMDAPAILWLGLIGGFLTPFLFHTSYQSAVALFGYIGVLSCAVAAVSALKRWPYFILAAGIGSVLIEFAWANDVFGRADPNTTRVIFLVIQALFLGISIVTSREESGVRWIGAAAAATGIATLVFCLGNASPQQVARPIFPTLFLANAGLIGLAVSHRGFASTARGLAAVVATAVFLTWLTEWQLQHAFVYNSAGAPWRVMAQPNSYLILWIVAILLLFSAVPYFCGTDRLWTWTIAGVIAPLQFWLVYRLVENHFPENGLWVLPLLFALPPAAGLTYLVRKERVQLESGDSRLAVQGAAVLGLVSLVFPIQFHREWITLGWALEGVGLVLLYRLVPNRRLRAVALIVFCAAFVRLALNQAVLHYHPRSQTPILNWYLYAYGIAGLCLFAGAYWFGEPRERTYERYGAPLLYTLSGIVLFLLLNIEIADYFSIGPTLTFSFAGNFARDMTYTISWSLFAFMMLILGMFKQIRALRFAAVALLCLALAKLFFHDLDSLNQLYRIAAFVSVAIIAIVASFAYQRFLSASKQE